MHALYAMYSCAWFLAPGTRLCTLDTTHWFTMSGQGSSYYRTMQNYCMLLKYLPFSRVAMALSISFSTRLVCFFVSMAGVARDNTNSLILIWWEGEGRSSFIPQAPLQTVQYATIVGEELGARLRRAKLLTNLYPWPSLLSSSVLSAYCRSGTSSVAQTTELPPVIKWTRL